MAVDRGRRDQLIKVLEEFQSGRFTNDEVVVSIDETIGWKSNDQGFIRIAQSISLSLEDPYRTYRKSSGAKAAEFDSWIDHVILFLKSGLEYRWRTPWSRWWMTLSRFLRINMRPDTGTVPGDYSVWPFYTQEEYEKAKMSHVRRPNPE